MYALPPRQRRRNNYSRTILADRASDMLPHLSRKQLLSVKELLISSGLVNSVISKTMTIRDILSYPTFVETLYPDYIYYILPIIQTGLHLNRVEIARPPIDLPTFGIRYGCHSKPDLTGTGTDGAYGPYIRDVHNCLILYPALARPFVAYWSPFPNFDAEPVTFNPDPVSPSQEKYPYLFIRFFVHQLPEPTDDVVCKLYYTN